MRHSNAELELDGHYFFHANLYLPHLYVQKTREYLLVYKKLHSSTIRQNFFWTHPIPKQVVYFQAWKHEVHEPKY